MSSRTEAHTLHFDLSGFSAEREFTLLAGDGRKVVLSRYADHGSKMDEHRARNPILGLIPEARVGSLTHFCEGAELSREKPSMRRIVFPSLDDHPLPEIAMVMPHIPRSHTIAAQRRFYRDGRRAAHPLALSAYGVHEEHYARLLADGPSDAGLDLQFAAQAVQPPGVTAQAIVLHHPELGSVNPGVMAYLKAQYLNPGQNPEMSDFIQYLQSTQPGEGSYTWYNKSWAMWSANPDGTGDLVPAQVDLGIKYKDGRTVTDWPQAPGQPYQGMPAYNLTDEYDPPNGKSANLSVVAAAGPTVRAALLATKNDATLNGQVWTKQDGVTATAPAAPKVVRSAPPRAAAPAPAPAAAAGLAGAALAESGSKGFAAKNLTSSYGLYTYDLSFDATKQELTFPVKNWPSRYLGAYIQFFRQDGTVIERKDIPNWPDTLPLDFLKGMLQPSGSKNYLNWLSSGNAVFGIPIPPLTQVRDLTFPWPHDASRGLVLLGGLGCASGFRDWDGDVCVVGVVGTGIVNYGVGAIMLAANVYVINPFITGLEGDAKIAFYAIAGVIGASALAGGVIERDTAAGKMILSKLSGVAASALFGAVANRLIAAGAKAFLKAFFDLSAEFMAELTAEEAVEAVPVAGWAVRIVAVAADIAALAATTVECVLSPATYSIEILRTMDLTVTVGPDPTHGKPGFKPVWPAVSDHYVIQVKYPSSGNQDGGTTYTLSGPMPGAHDQDIVVTFPGLPAGGKVEVVASIYSANDWLAGLWNSGWIDAVPDASDALAASGSITELLVPLTPTTRYSQKQTIGYSQADRHVWIVSAFSIEAALASDLDKGGTPDAAIVAAFRANGNALSSAAAITVVTAGQHWTLDDNQSGARFDLTVKPIAGGAEIAVQNTAQAAPPLPQSYPLPAAPSGHALGGLQNIIINDREFQLGYAYLASGQNMPLDGQPGNTAVPMYAMQSVSTLGQPQEQIYEPTKGFSQPTFLAYDQFGLTPLFSLPPDLATTLKDGPVDPVIAKDFAAFGYRLAPDAVVSVVTAGKSWTVGSPGRAPDYELRLGMDLTDGQPAQRIGVYAYPVPAIDNFFLEPQPPVPGQPRAFALRGVKLDLPPGQYTFDYSTPADPDVWGVFQSETPFQEVVVHPNGYVIALDNTNAKMYTLKLPAAAMSPAEAPLAMPLAGKGGREGLLDSPQAMTVAADGRILVLETGTQYIAQPRIQAFDVKGNPVPSFSVGQPSFQVVAGAAALIGQLDATTVSPTLLQLFQQHFTPAVAPKAVLTDSLSEVAADLDAGSVDATLIAALQAYGLAGAGAKPGDYTVSTTSPGTLWFVADAASRAVYDVRLVEDPATGYDVLDVYAQFGLSITILSAGSAWRIGDSVNGMTFGIKKAAADATLTVTQLSSWMPLRAQTVDGSLTYLDVASETKGYIYVLSVLDNNYNATKDPKDLTFQLDIYNPDGSTLLAAPQPGVNAGKITVDQYRSLFSLNFNVVIGPNARTEPGVSQWIPSTPAPAV